MEFSELIRQFAERFDVEIPEIADDAVAFDVDGMPFFVMRVANEGESEYLVVAADLGEPPPERLEKLYQVLLDAGHNFAVAGGGVFARNPHDGHIWLESREALSSLDVEAALAKVKSLGEAAVNWRDVIREYREGTPVSGPGPQDGGQGGEIVAGFMQV